MNCNCLTELNERLKAENLELSSDLLSFRMPSFKVSINLPMRWRDKSKAPKGKKSSPPSALLNAGSMEGKG